MACRSSACHDMYFTPMKLQNMKMLSYTSDILLLSRFSLWYKRTQRGTFWICVLGSFYFRIQFSACSELTLLLIVLFRSILTRFISIVLLFVLFGSFVPQYISDFFPKNLQRVLCIQFHCCVTSNTVGCFSPTFSRNAIGLAGQLSVSIAEFECVLGEEQRLFSSVTRSVAKM